jgi:serine/threonine protein kinase
VISNAIIRGAFSVVKEATHKETGVKYAIKFVSKKYVAQKDLSLLMREIEIMKKLRHDNIVQLIDVAETADDIYIVMEL